MLQKDYEQCPPQGPQCCYSYLNGYFGKPTKLRTSQPSMFEILTWNSGLTDPLKAHQVQKKQCCNCNCQCGKYNQAAFQQNPKVNQKQFANPHPMPNQQMKKINEQEKRKELPKGREQYSHNIKNQKDQIIDRPEHVKQQRNEQKHFNHQTRPKSAGPTPKRVKEMVSPPRSPKFATNMNKSQVIVQEEPAQTKEKLIQKFKQTTRWIPNSAFTTYFGKPAFQNYGRGNTNPTCGGLMYGNYLKTHNIQPHRGVNSPKNIQSYNVALMKGQQIGAVYPYPPKVHRNEAPSPAIKNHDEMQSSQIYAEQNNFRSFPIYPPNLYELQKFGGKGIQKASRSRLERSNIDKQNEYNAEEYEKEGMKNRMVSPKRYAY